MAKLRLLEPDDDLLPLLRSSTNDLLDPLVDYITDSGKGRVTSELDGIRGFKTNYGKGNHLAYVDEIAAEIQLFGGNTIMNAARGYGVSYKEVACDVATRLKVDFSETDDVANIEVQVLLKILEKAYEKMSDEERRALLKEFGWKHGKRIPPTLPIAVLQAAVLAGRFAAFQLAVIVANAVAKQLLGHGLSLAFNASLTKTLGTFAGPIGLAITVILTAISVAGPAYRVTIPCVVQMALIRTSSGRERKRRPTSRRARGR